MSGERDFDVLYQETPGHIRANANLPGHHVFTLTRLDGHGDFMIGMKETLEATKPGYGDTWDWEDYGIPPHYNPVKDFVQPYSQFSRAEAMKGSEQVVRGFQGFQPEGIEGIGEPNLTPKPRPHPTVVIMNGVKEGVQKKKRFQGFGRG